MISILRQGGQVVLDEKLKEVDLGVIVNGVGHVCDGEGTQNLSNLLKWKWLNAA